MIVYTAEVKTKNIFIEKGRKISLFFVPYFIYTKCNYKIGQISEVIFYQDDEKKQVDCTVL